MLEVIDLAKDYPTPRGPLPVLSGITLSLAPGDAISIVGPSGSGKSTLLYILGALEPPSSGVVRLDGQNPFELSEPRQAAFRNRNVGFVFQDHCLLSQCSVLENVLAPTLVSTIAQRDRAVVDRASSLLTQVGLADRIDHRPAELSGGEKQRVALARALVLRPRLLLCDEPTGNLDRQAASAVAALLMDLDGRRDAILVIATHSRELAATCPMRFELADRSLRRI